MPVFQRDVLTHAYMQQRHLLPVVAHGLVSFTRGPFLYYENENSFPLSLLACIPTH